MTTPVTTCTCIAKEMNGIQPMYGILEKKLYSPVAINHNLMRLAKSLCDFSSIIHKLLKEAFFNKSTTYGLVILKTKEKMGNEIKKIGMDCSYRVTAEILVTKIQPPVRLCHEVNTN